MLIRPYCAKTLSMSHCSIFIFSINCIQTTLITTLCCLLIFTAALSLSIAQAIYTVVSSYSRAVHHQFASFTTTHQTTYRRLVKNYSLSGKDYSLLESLETFPYRKNSVLVEELCNFYEDLCKG